MKGTQGKKGNLGSVAQQRKKDIHTWHWAAKAIEMHGSEERIADDHKEIEKEDRKKVGGSAQTFTFS